MAVKPKTKGNPQVSLTATGKTQVYGFPMGGINDQGSTLAKPAPFDASTVPRGWVALVGQVYAVCMLDGPPVPTGGYAQWEVASRAGRKGAANFDGFDPMTMDVPLFLDTFRTDGSVEFVINALEALALPDPAHAYGKPAVPSPIKIYGIGIPHRDKVWVIAGLQWDTDSVEFNSRDQKTRQKVVVSLMEYEHTETLKVSKVRKTAPKKKVPCSKAKSPKKKYRWRKGDTLHKVAAKYLGDAKCWKQIATLNKVRTGRDIKVNQEIRLP